MNSHKTYSEGSFVHTKVAASILTEDKKKLQRFKYDSYDIAYILITSS